MKTPILPLLALAGCLFALHARGAVVEVSMTTNPEVFEFRGDAKDDHLGNASAQASQSIASGDLNGDGYEDIVIGSEDEGTLGAVHVVFGRATWSSTGSLMASIVDVKIAGVTSEKISSAVAVGDVNGDGIGDLILGSKNADPGSVTNSGAVYLFFGATSWTSTRTLASADVKISGNTTGGNLGYAVAAADINGDGVKDVIASAPGQDIGSYTNNGQVAVYFGSTTWSSAIAMSSANVLISGPRTSSALATHIWSGDYNDDGTADLFFSSYHDDDPSHTSAGYSGVIWGIMGRATASWSATIVANSTNVDFYSAGTSSYYGIGYRGACGDIDGDGTDDVIALATDSATTYTMIYYGGSVTGGGDAAPDYFISYGNPNNNNGIPSALALDDFDADGIQDIAVGFGTSSPGGSLFAGCVTVHYGRSVWNADETDDVKYTGEVAGDYLGMAVAFGDTNGDGAADLLFNTPYYDGTGGRTSAGKVYLIAGSVAEEPAMTFSMSGSTLTLGMSGRSGMTCRLEHSTDLSTWTEVTTWNTDGSDYEYDATVSGAAGFYRIKVNP
ncbi:MAG: VCBS repeat-containing protein [Verrucomicrobiaceae bacterium]|nr:VCBS repeat-containing protein [Verrucomicrobiaceae bacterium]